MDSLKLLSEKLEADPFIQASQGLNHGLLVHNSKQILFVNEYLTGLIGLSRAEMVGLDPASLIVSSQKSRVRKLINNRQAKRTFSDNYSTLLQSSGSRQIPVQVASFPLDFKKIRLTISFVTDTSDVRMARKRLEENEQKYRNLFHNSQVAMFRVDRRGKVIEANTKLLSILDTSPSASTDSINLAKLIISQEQRKEFLNYTPEYAKGRELEVEIVTAKGARKWLLLNYRHFAQGEYSEGVAIDVSLDKLEEQRNTYLSSLGSLLTRLSTSFIELPTEEVDLGINQSLGSIAEFCGADAAIVLLDENNTGYVPTHSWALKSGTKSATLANLLHKALVSKGVSPKLAVWAAPEKISAAQPFVKLKDMGVTHMVVLPIMRGNDRLGVLMFSSSSSKNPWINDTLPFLQIAAEMIANALMRKNIDQQVSSLYDSQSELFSQIAHSLKTPFTVALSNLELLKKCNQPKERLEYIESTKSNLREANSIVSQLLKIAKMDLFPVGSRLVRIEATELLNTLYSKASKLYKSHFPYATEQEIQQNLNLEKVEEAIIVSDDKAILEALLIVVDNSIIHSPGKGKLPNITISAVNLSHSYKIAVKDTGIGIAKRELNKVFDLYYQAKDSAGGTGIGLAYCKKIIEAQGGEIAITSKQNKGTTVTIKLPID